MGTVLSFSPRENHPIYSTHHRGSGTVSTSSSADFSLNNYAYEQMNNIKNINRENINSKSNIISNNNGSSLVLFGSSNSNIMNNNLNNTNNSSMEDRASDNARIMLEKNALEKNMKKHSLFINALSWKRLSASHGKKKLDNYNSKNKGNLNTTSFRSTTGLTDIVHPMVANDKNKNYQQQQIQFASNHNNIINNNNNININNIKDSTQSIYFSPAPKSLLALDLERATNANLQHHQHVDKLGPKMPIQLPMALQPTNAMLHHQQHQQQLQQQQQQQQMHYRAGSTRNQQQPKKTIIQVSCHVLYELILSF